MCRAAFILLLATLLSCGGDEIPTQGSASAPPTPSEAADREPVVSSFRLVPSNPSSAEPLSAALRVHDPEGRPLEVEYAWYRNGELVLRGARNTLPTSATSRGDRIHAVATVRDGTNEISARTPVVRVRNEPPQILQVRLGPPEPTVEDPLLAQVEVRDVDGDAVELEYRWFVNDRLLDDTSGASLDAGWARRGDRVQVAAAGRDGRDRGEWMRSGVLKIRNAPPRIVSRPSFSLSEGNRYTYQVEVVDPDEDRPLRFALEEAPPGMKIDLVSGLVSWSVPSDASGKYPVALTVSDPHGARTRQTYVLDLRWDEVPASTP
ncbi:MAG: putative Ig domain-containing protein [Myxococcota bacterium]